jgi:hypothetical protein
MIKDSYGNYRKTITPKECAIDQLWGLLNNYKFDHVCSQLRRAVLAELINRIIKSNSQEVRNDRNEN